MSQEVRFGFNIFGYATLVRDGDTLVALTGDGKQELRLGMIVELLGDSRRYVPSGFSVGDQVEILGFREPFKTDASDHIVEVGNESLRGWVKPSNVQRIAEDRQSGIDEPVVHWVPNYPSRKRDNPVKLVALLTDARVHGFDALDLPGFAERHCRCALITHQSDASLLTTRICI